jgi:hypothetical protein
MLTFIICASLLAHDPASRVLMPELKSGQQRHTVGDLNPLLPYNKGQTWAEMRSELQISVEMLIVVLWLVTPYSLVGSNQHFEGMNHFHFQGCSELQLNKELIHSSETLITTIKTTQHHNPEDKNQHG